MFIIIFEIDKIVDTAGTVETDTADTVEVGDTAEIVVVVPDEEFLSTSAAVSLPASVSTFHLPSA